MTNRNILYLFAILLTMSIVCACGSYATSVSIYKYIFLLNNSNNIDHRKRKELIWAI